MKNYKILEKVYNGLKVIEIENQINGEYFNIIPNYGGAINEIVLNKKNNLYPIHNSAKSLKEFEEVLAPMYSGTFLAPFPNRVKKGQYQSNGFTTLRSLLTS